MLLFLCFLKCFCLIDLAYFPGHLNHVTTHFVNFQYFSLVLKPYYCYFIEVNEHNMVRSPKGWIDIHKCFNKSLYHQGKTTRHCWQHKQILHNEFLSPINCNVVYLILCLIVSLLPSKILYNTLHDLSLGIFCCISPTAVFVYNGKKSHTRRQSWKLAMLCLSHSIQYGVQNYAELKRLAEKRGQSRTVASTHCRTNVEDDMINLHSLLS